MINAWWNSIPGMESGKARDMANYEYINRGVNESFGTAMRTVSFVLNGPINVNADDAEAFADSVQRSRLKILAYRH